MPAGRDFLKTAVSHVFFAASPAACKWDGGRTCILQCRSNLLCEGKDVKKVGLHYHETYNAFVHKEIDLVVQRDDCEEYQIYKNKSVSLDYLGLDEQIMTPVILINKEDYGMEELMKNNVNVIEMAAIQKDVMEGKMDPSYY